MSTSTLPWSISGRWPTTETCSKACARRGGGEALARPSNRLGHHLDRPARAFGGAEAAAFAIVVVELESLAGPELDDRVVGADAVAIVAFEAVAAAQTPARLVERVGLVKPAHDLLEILNPAHRLEHGPDGRRRVLVIPGVEPVEARERVLVRRRKSAAVQIGVDAARGLLAVADGDGDGALRGRHVAAGEDAPAARHHVRPDLDDAVLDHDARRSFEQGQIDVLAERQHQRVGLERLELAGRLRKAGFIELHLLDRHRAAFY